MAAQQDDTVYPDEDLDDEEESPDDDDLDDEEDLNSGSPSAPISDPSSAVTVAVPGTTTVSNGKPLTTILVDSTAASDSKRLHALTVVNQEEKKPFDESRRLFQRLWTDEDEIELLQGFLEYTTKRGRFPMHHHDTALFYDQIKNKLQLEFNKNQLGEKLRRLKKKYRNVLNRISSGKELSFKSPHDQATFEISRKIWGGSGRVGVEDHASYDDDLNANAHLNFHHDEVKIEENVGNSAEKKNSRSRKRCRPQSQPELGTVEKRVLNDGIVPNVALTGCNNNMTGLIEETLRSCLPPLVKELLSNNMSGPCGSRGSGELNLNLMPLSFSGLGSSNSGSGQVLDEKWRKQQILELEVYSKRLELVQSQIRATLEEFRAGRGSRR